MSLKDQLVPGNVVDLSALYPGYGPRDYLETLNRTVLQKICSAHGLMGMAINAFRERQPNLEEHQYRYPPAMIMRAALRERGITGTEPLPEKRDETTPASVRTEYDKWAFPALRKECSDRGIDWSKTDKKTALIAKLQRHDDNHDSRRSGKDEADFAWPKRS